MEGCRPASRGCALKLMTYVNARTRPSAASTDVRPEVRIVRSTVASRMASAARKSRRLAVGVPVVPGQLAAPPTRVRALSDASASTRQRIGTRIRRCRADPPSPLDPCHGVGPRKRPEPPLALRGGDPKQTSERQRPRREEGLFAAARQELAPGRRICGLDDARPHDPAEVERTTFGRHDEECTRAQDRLVELVARGC